MQRITITLPKEMLDEMDFIIEQGSVICSRSQLIRIALSYFFEREVNNFDISSEN